MHFRCLNKRATLKGRYIMNDDVSIHLYEGVDYHLKFFS
jgi:hypothetical protein